MKEQKYQINNNRNESGGFWFFIGLAVVLFYNYGDNKHDLYDLIYKILEKIAKMI